MPAPHDTHERAARALRPKPRPHPGHERIIAAAIRSP